MPALAVHTSQPVLSTVADTDSVVMTHLPLIQTIAKRIVKRLPPSVEVDELVNIGVIGLLDAWDRFDASKGVPFRSYAEMRIKGQIIDALRADDIVPRSVRRKHNRLEQERTTLRNRLGRTPTRDEMRGQLDMSPKAYDKYVTDSRIAKVLSLDAPTNEEDESSRFVDTLSNLADTAEETLSNKELRKAVAESVQFLPEKERYAVTQYYIFHRTLKSIGTDLNVTESRACQLRSQGVKRLRFRLRAMVG
ncbi:MAG: RNA polymerase sigma factor WhiG [Deltaproteobacteria bacterium]|nr:RNA polymerase sigma factor WhiG [Deltaproteobacteria bacterium]HCH65077.1 RNA polymerase sigma factor WhiG [Deltaproteobacteria bacterium]